MAYATPIEITELPDTFQYITFAQDDSIVGASPVFYCERDTVIDAGWAKALTAGTNLTFRIDNTTALTTTAAVTTAGAALVLTTTNVVPAGSWITMTSTATAGKQIAATLRIRTRIG